MVVLSSRTIVFYKVGRHMTNDENTMARSWRRRLAGGVAVAAALAGVSAVNTQTSAGAKTAAAPPSSRLVAVACNTPRSCFAVGQSDNRLFAKHWNGTSWSVVPLPSPRNSGSYSALNTVACGSPTSCVAFGTSSKPFVVHWDGSRWTLGKIPSIGGEQSLVIWGVACARADSCQAVGAAGRGTYGAFTATTQWDGKRWSRVAIDGTSSGSGYTLSSVACPEAKSCIAVGSGGGVDFAQRWNGTTWSAMTPLVDVGPENSWLSSVSCTSSRNCYASGTWDRDGTLIEHWDGAAWTIVPSPYPPFGVYVNVGGISCKAKGCVAVGNGSSYSTYPLQATIAIHQDRTTWTIRPSQPHPAPSYSWLYGVACIDVKNCFAVGAQIPTLDSYQVALIEHWNGRTWSAVG